MTVTALLSLMVDLTHTEARRAPVLLNGRRTVLGSLHGASFGRTGTLEGASMRFNPTACIFASCQQVTANPPTAAVLFCWKKQLCYL